jgi:hypothetical protein
MIGFADVDKFRQGQLWKLIERLASQSGQVNAMQMMAMQSQIQNARDTFVCLVDKDSPVAVSRVKDDITLEAAAQASGALPGKPAPSGPAPSSPPKTHAGVAYMSFSQGFVAKVAPSTFCTAKREQDLQAALDRLQRKEAVALSPELQLAFKSKNGDHYLAMTDLSSFGNPMPSRPGSMPDPKWIAAGISGNATVQVDVTIGFASAADAGRIKAEFDGAMQKADQELGKLPPQAPPQIKAVIQKLLGMIHAIRLNQSGDTIRATASWQVKDIEELVNTAQSMGGMGGPGAGPPF